MARTIVVILNGIGSVGKSSTARALQAIASRPFLHVEMDAFIAMLPPAMMGHPDGLVFTTGREDGGPSVAISSGPVMARTMRGMRQAVAAMAREGNDLIVDEVMTDPATTRDYRDLLGAFDLRLVGLFAPLDVLEARERDRGDRLIGLARWQFPRVHRGIEYDLEIDTTAATPLDGAHLIKAAFDL